MMSTFDVLLVDLQDVGCRIYTFITTLRYVLEEAARHGKAVWVLDRPNPAGRPVEGLRLRDGWESFVGAGPLPMRHGLTLGELGHWFVDTLRLDVDYDVIPMRGWQPDAAPGFGWPLDERTWVNPSPNAANLSMARCYAGTVMLEGTTLSEGRGTTRPLELFGAPDIDARALRAAMYELAPQWLQGCRLRECWFEPTFHKHVGQAVLGAADPRRRCRTTITRHSGRGGSWRWRSRRCVRCSATIRCGAIFRTNTKWDVSRSTSSTAARCCANGWTIRTPASAIWRRLAVGRRRRVAPGTRSRADLSIDARPLTCVSGIAGRKVAARDDLGRVG